VAAALHLDHCEDLTFAVACMEAGWDSALFDASGLELDQAIALTRDLVRRGVDRGFDVEGEIQTIGSAAGGVAPNVVTDVERSVSFVERTGVACFSPAIGTVHGATPDELSLDWEGLGKLAELTRLPLVLHGASGVDAAVVRCLIDHGFAKVNYSTALKAAFSAVLDQHRESPFDEPLRFVHRTHDVIDAAVRACIQTVESGGQTCTGAVDGTRVS
jgi:fructose/tagatose bisphosphate aldolase